MKSNWCRKVLKEEVVEIKDTLPKTIEKLRSLNQIGRERDCNDDCFRFVCNKKGTFSISHCFESEAYKIAFVHQWDREYYIYGKVFEQSGRTYIKYQQVYNRLIDFGLLFLLVFALMLIICGIIITKFYELSQFWNFAFIIMLIPFVALGIDSIKCRKKRKDYKNYDFDKMEKELIRRIDAVNNWDK